MNDDQAPPTMRRISPDDRSTPNSAAVNQTLKTPDGWHARSPRPSAASCEGCGGAGWYVLAVPYGHPDFCKLQPCDCAAYAARLEPRAARLGDELGSLRHQTFASFDLERPIEPTVWRNQAMSVPAQQNFMRAAHARCEAWAENPRGWLYLHGAFGAGKSHLAAAIANEQQRAGAIVRFVTVNKLLDVLRAGIDANDGSPDRLLADLLNCGCLILDELAQAHLAECAGDWRFGRIERLINERLDKPTVITSNLGPDDLASAGDVRAERLADRIAGASQIVWMPIASYRRLPREVAS